MNEWTVLYERIIFITENLIEKLIIDEESDKYTMYYTSYLLSQQTSDEKINKENKIYSERFVLLIKTFKKNLNKLEYLFLPKIDLDNILEILIAIQDGFNKDGDRYQNIKRINDLIDKAYRIILPYTNSSYSVNLDNIDLYEKIYKYKNTISNFEKEKEALILDFKKIINNSQSEYEKTLNMHEKFLSLYNEYFSYDNDSQKSVAQSLNILSKDIKDKHDEIYSFYRQLITDKESIKTQVTSSHAVIKDRENELGIKIQELDIKINEINSFHKDIYGDGNKDTGIKKNIEDRKNQLSDFEKNQKDRHEALRVKIESLLPGATSAGLAKSYHDQKDKYDESITHNTYIFYGIIAVMSVASFVISTSDISFSPLSIEFVKINNIEDISSFLFFRLPVLLPLIWLAVFVSRRRSECERLKQEYTHKAALASSYESFKQQIKDIDGEKADILMEKLLDSAITTISHNASLTLDKKTDESMPIIGIVEKTVDKVLEKMPSKNKED